MLYNSAICPRWLPSKVFFFKDDYLSDDAYVHSQLCLDKHKYIYSKSLYCDVLVEIYAIPKDASFAHRNEIYNIGYRQQDNE